MQDSDTEVEHHTTVLYERHFLDKIKIVQFIVQIVQSALILRLQIEQFLAKNQYKDAPLKDFYCTIYAQMNPNRPHVFEHLNNKQS